MKPQMLSRVGEPLLIRLPAGGARPRLRPRFPWRRTAGNLVDNALSVLVRDVDEFNALVIAGRVPRSACRAAVLESANLRGVILADLDLHGANLRESDLSECRAARAIFDSAILVETRFDRGQLMGASFRDAYIRGASFSGADLTAATFDGATLVNVDLRNCMLDDGALARAVVKP